MSNISALLNSEWKFSFICLELHWKQKILTHFNYRLLCESWAHMNLQAATGPVVIWQKLLRNVWALLPRRIWHRWNNGTRAVPVPGERKRCSHLSSEVRSMMNATRSIRGRLSSTGRGRLLASLLPGRATGGFLVTKLRVSCLKCASTKIITQLKLYRRFTTTV